MKQFYKCPSCNTTLVIDDQVKSAINCPKCPHKGTLDTFKQVVKKERYCSSCGHKWDEFFGLNEQVPSEFICPSCGSRSESTVFVNNNAMMIPGVLEMINDMDNLWIGANTTFILKQGVNTIGRKAKEPKAQILMPTKDSYMGRCHIKIEVTKNSSGIMEHYIVDNGSVNGVYLNGEKLCPGQVLGLEIDDEIKLGHTVFIFRACTPFDLEKSE